MGWTILLLSWVCNMPLDISRIHALCFDVDGTLSDTDDLFVQNLAAWLKPFHFLFRQRDPHRFARWFVMATETPGTFVFGLPDRLGFDDRINHLGDWLYRRGIGKATQPSLMIAQVKETLARLYTRYPMAVVSARGQRGTLAFLEKFDLLAYFQYVATGQTCRHAKPYPDQILWAADQMGIDPRQCLMIGDTTVDILAGRAAGAQTVGVLCGFGEEEELRHAGADLILPTTSLLTNILDT